MLCNWILDTFTLLFFFLRFFHALLFWLITLFLHSYCYQGENVSERGKGDGERERERERERQTETERVSERETEDRGRETERDVTNP